MADDAVMRAELQRVAAYRELCAQVRRGGRHNAVFAGLMLLLAASAAQQPGGVLTVSVFAGLALAELLIGLYKWLAPSAEGVLLDAVVLLAFAGWNLFRNALLFQAGAPVERFGVFIGLFLLWGAVGRFKAYRQLRRHFAERPTREQMAWFDDLVAEIRRSDPEADTTALDLPTKPAWKAKLLGSTAFVVAAKGDAAVVAGPWDIDLTPGRAGRGRPRVVLRLYDREFPPFEIDPASFRNYLDWAAAAPHPMIEVRDLSKWFRGPDGGRVTAVDALRFTVRPGEVFGLLGPNGAGKTTTLRMLCTVLRPTAGTATVAGYDVVTQPSEVRRHVGFLSANTGVYDRMTAWEMVEYYGRLHEVPADVLRPRMEELFDSLQITAYRDTPGAKMSTGTRQKVSIARALVNDPPVLIFDEPTNGLDVLVQRAVLDSIKALRGRGKTILFSTHIMREVEKLCDRVAIMARGGLVVCGTLDDLRAMHNEPDLEELFFSLVS